VTEDEKVEAVAREICVQLGEDPNARAFDDRIPWGKEVEPCALWELHAEEAADAIRRHAIDAAVRKVLGEDPR
jgi:hypothetical protein